MSPKTASDGSRKWWVLITVIFGTFLGRLDQTIVNLALPKIIEDFSITVSAAGWIATAYILANAVFVPIWGKLGDTIGRKRVYLTGFGIFIIGSALAGLAWNLSSMIVFRIIQAIASSADYPTAMAIIAVTFTEEKERAQALGIWSVAFAAAAVFGPLIGGPLIDHFGWRSVFLINLPVGLIGLLMAIFFIEESKSTIRSYNFDWWGAITLGTALAALVLVLDRGVEWGWTSSRSFVLYLVVVVFGILFYIKEVNHPEPIVDFKFFKIDAFTRTLINSFTVFMGLMAGVFLIPIFVETYLGYDATKTGMLFMPMAFAMMIASPLGGRLVGKYRAGRVIAVSSFIGAIGILLLVKFIDPLSTPIDIILPLLVMAFGLGFGMPQRTTIIASSVPESEVGIASSVLALARNIAGAFGIAIASSILTQRTNSALLDIASNSIINLHTPLVLQEAATLMVLKAQIIAYKEVFLVSFIIMTIGALSALSINVKSVSKDVKHQVID